jgi:ribosome-binding factor A
VFYTVYGDDQQVEDSARALASATGVLRSTVGKQTGIKFVPTLTFVADVVPDTARELEEALERVRHADAELARAREGAQYAGDADPYRKPPTDEDDDEPEDDALVAESDGDLRDGRVDDFDDQRPSAAAQRNAS